jgi:hypothetical protein
MPNRSLYHCPHLGCNQTSTRRWNMQVHIKRRHKDGHWSVPTSKQPSFSPNQKVAAETSSQYMYGPPYRLNTSVDEGKNTEDKNLETFRMFHDFRRSLALLVIVCWFLSYSESGFELSDLFILFDLWGFNLSCKSIRPWISINRVVAGWVDLAR